MAGSIHKVFYRKNIKVRAWSWMGQYMGQDGPRVGHIGSWFWWPKKSWVIGWVAETWVMKKITLGPSLQHQIAIKFKLTEKLIIPHIIYSYFVKKNWLRSKNSFLLFDPRRFKNFENLFVTSIQLFFAKFKWKIAIEKHKGFSRDWFIFEKPYTRVEETSNLSGIPDFRGKLPETLA